MSDLNVGSFVDKLKKLENSQASITTLSKFISYHADQAPLIATVWAREFLRFPEDKQLVQIYLVNDVLQSTRASKQQTGRVFAAAFMPALRTSFAMLAAKRASTLPKAQRVLNIWRERQVLTSAELAQLDSAVSDPEAVLDSAEDESAGLLLAVGEGAAALISSPLHSTAATRGAEGGSDGEYDDSYDSSAVARPLSPLHVLESQLLRGGGGAFGAPPDITSLIASSKEAREREHTFDALQGLLASVESGEIGLSLSREGVATVPAQLSRVFVVEAQADDKATQLAASMPFAVHEVAKQVNAHVEQLSGEKRRREAAVEALTDLVAAEAEAGGARDEAHIATATQLLQNARAVRRRLEDVVKPIQALPASTDASALSSAAAPTAPTAPAAAPTASAAATVDFHALMRAVAGSGSASAQTAEAYSYGQHSYSASSVPQQQHPMQHQQHQQQQQQMAYAQSYYASQHAQQQQAAAYGYAGYGQQPQQVLHQQQYAAAYGGYYQ